MQQGLAEQLVLMVLLDRKAPLEQLERVPLEPPESWEQPVLQEQLESWEQPVLQEQLEYRVQQVAQGHKEVPEQLVRVLLV